MKPRSTPLPAVTLDLASHRVKLSLGIHAHLELIQIGKDVEPMNTTLLFIELLIIGLEGWIWIILILLSIFPMTDLNGTLSALKDWQAFVYSAVLALTYVVGVIIDRVADRSFRWVEKRVGKNIVGDLAEPISVLRFSLGTQNDFLNQQLDYTRTRLRIVRASTLNFPMIAFSLCVFISRRPLPLQPNELWSYIGWIALIGVLVTGLSLKTLESLVKAHLRLVRNMYDYQIRVDRAKVGRKK